MNVSKKKSVVARDKSGSLSPFPALEPRSSNSRFQCRVYLFSVNMPFQTTLFSDTRQQSRALEPVLLVSPQRLYLSLSCLLRAPRRYLRLQGASWRDMSSRRDWVRTRFKFPSPLPPKSNVLTSQPSWTAFVLVLSVDRITTRCLVYEVISQWLATWMGWPRAVRELTLFGHHAHTQGTIASMSSITAFVPIGLRVSVAQNVRRHQLSVHLRGGE